MINVIYRYSLLAAFFTIISGCTFHHSLKPEESSNLEVTYPIIKLVVAPKADWVTRRYIEYLNEIKEEFLKRNKFSVASSSSFSPYAIEIIHDFTDKRSHPQMIWWTLTALSLFVVPSQHEMEHTMDINIYKNGKLVKHYSYTDLVTGWTMLFSPGGLSAGDTHVNFLNQFFNDIARDNIFTDTGGINNAIKV